MGVVVKETCTPLESSALLACGRREWLVPPSATPSLRAVVNLPRQGEGRESGQVGG